MNRNRTVRLVPCRRMPLLLLLCMLAPAGLSAQSDTLPRRDTTVFRVEGVSVHARRPVITVGGASGVRITVDSLNLAPGATTEDLFREIPALHVRTNSRGEAEVTVRGSESRQVAVLLDGVPLTLGWDARTDVSILPATAIESVTFVRGLSSILHGPNVLGGVVELSLAGVGDFPRDGRSTASAGIDHTGGYGASATTTQPFAFAGGSALFRAGAGYRDSPGTPLPGDVAEPTPASDDDLRLNTDVDNADGFLALRWLGESGAWASMSAVANRGERGIAAELGADDPRLWRYPHVSRTILAASSGTGHHDTPFGRGDMEASVGVDVGSSEIRSYATRAYDEVIGSEDGDDRTLTLRLMGDHTLGSRGDLRGSATYADIVRDQVVDDDAARYRQQLFSLGAETVWNLVNDPTGAVQSLTLSLGGAWDRAATPETGGHERLDALDDWGARVGLSAVVSDGSAVLHTGISRRGRFPSLRETYSEALNRFVPNPGLTAEHLVAFEAGVTTRVARGELQVVGFRHDLDGAIRRITLADGRRQRINSDQLESTGVEVMLTQSLDRFDIGADMTLQSVELTGPGTAASTQPENVPGQVGRAWARYTMPGGAWVRGEAEYTGSQFCQDPDTGDDVELAAGTWLNASLGKVWDVLGGGRRLETSISGANLADAVLHDQCGLPRAGRLVRLQLRVF